MLQAFQILHPGVEILSSHELVTTLVSMRHGDFEVMMSHRLRGKKCTLDTDGWSDINGKSVINYVLDCEGAGAAHTARIPVYEIAILFPALLSPC
ncbi:hypothetical protein PI126_g2548 [Phytophthora idaei]|nr:hypothetical protein PI126_g2548 [Phytophthora idaei]